MPRRKPEDATSFGSKCQWVCEACGFRRNRSSASRCEICSVECRALKLGFTLPEGAFLCMVNFTGSDTYTVRAWHVSSLLKIVFMLEGDESWPPSEEVRSMLVTKLSERMHNGVADSGEGSVKQQHSNKRKVSLFQFTMDSLRGEINNVGDNHMSVTTDSPVDSKLGEGATATEAEQPLDSPTATAGFASKYPELMLQNRRAMRLRTDEIGRTRAVERQDQELLDAYGAVAGTGLRRLRLQVEVPPDIPVRLSHTHRACGLCERVFPIHALLGLSSYRAVAELRRSWGQPLAANHSGTRSFAALYSEVGLCVFCTQFVDVDFGRILDQQVVPQLQHTGRDDMARLSQHRRAERERHGAWLYSADVQRLRRKGRAPQEVSMAPARTKQDSLSLPSLGGRGKGGGAASLAASAASMRSARPRWARVDAAAAATDSAIAPQTKLPAGLGGITADPERRGERRRGRCKQPGCLCGEFLPPPTSSSSSSIGKDTLPQLGVGGSQRRRRRRPRQQRGGSGAAGSATAVECLKCKHAHYWHRRVHSGAPSVAPSRKRSQPQQQLANGVESRRLSSRPITPDSFYGD